MECCRKDCCREILHLFVNKFANILVPQRKIAPSAELEILATCSMQVRVTNELFGSSCI